MNLGFAAYYYIILGGYLGPKVRKNLDGDNESYQGLGRLVAERLA